MFACLCLVSSRSEQPVELLLQLAGDFSPRYEMVRPHLVVVEIGGLRRLLGTPRAIGEAFCRLARERGMVVSVGIAATRTTALLCALHRAPEAFADPDDAGCLTVVAPGREAAALASLPLALLALLPDDRLTNDDVAFLRRRKDPDAAEQPVDGAAAASNAAASGRDAAPGKTRGWRGRGWSQNYRLAPAPLPSPPEASPSDETGRLAVASPERALSLDVSPSPSPADERRAAILEILRRWGLKTLGELARLPAVDLFERLGRDGLALQQIAFGYDARPLVPTTLDEPFEATLALEWPIEELEPLSFVLTRVFEPLCARLEQCDRGAAVLHVTLQLVTRACHVRRLELPAPMRDPKVLRTLVLLDLESHPPDAGIDRITIAIDPTPGRIVQHSLLTRPLPSPEQLSTLTARLIAVMGEGRVGAPALVDTHRPEAFELHRFEVHESAHRARRRRAAPRASAAEPPARLSSSAFEAHYVLRRFRRAIPARVRVEEGRPVHVTPQGLPGGRVVQAAGPWRTSGEWWHAAPRLQPLKPAAAAAAKAAAAATAAAPATVFSAIAPAVAVTGPRPRRPSLEPTSWDRDEWDVALDNGRIYRLHLDHVQARWYLEAMLD